MNTLNIKFYNNNTQEITNGILSYEIIKENDDCKIQIKLNNKIHEKIDLDYFSSLQIIRDEIYPWIPMLKGCLIDAYPSGMSKSMSKGTSLYNLTLSKQSDIDDTSYIFDEINTSEKIVSSNIQESFHQIWGYSFYMDYKEEGIKKDTILIEKVKKYSYMDNNETNKIDKILNKNYQYFWIYDKEKNLIYDIENKEDIEKFNNNLIKPLYESFDEFLEYYENNYLNRRR